jgi:HAD superfamily hydrolase (TIGR01458 family)
MDSKDLQHIRLFIMDIDGVLCWGDDAIPRAPEAIDALLMSGKEVRYLTNDSVSSRTSRASELHEQGFHVSPDEIYTASSLTAQYLRSLGSPSSLVLSGGEGLEEFVGITLVQDSAEVVVVGDFFDSYSRSLLERAYDAVINGAQLIATQKNRHWMFGDQPRIDLGFWVAGLEYCAGIEAKVIGKPSIECYQIVLQDAGASHHEAAMVSDDLYSDLAGAKRAGLTTIHISSHPVPSETIDIPAADLTIESLAELARLLVGR